MKVLRIMAVEDEETMCNILKIILEKETKLFSCKCIVHVVKSIAEFWTQFNEEQEDNWLVLLDNHVGRENAVETVLPKLIAKKVPTIVTSGNIYEVEEPCKNQPLVTTLAKPYNPQTLEAKIVEVSREAGYPLLS